MSTLISIHPDTPQTRLIHNVVNILNKGGIIIYPTDSFYAIGCLATNQAGVKRIANIKKFDKHHLFTLICYDMSFIGKLTILSNANFRNIKSNTPGANTFILPASNNVPKYLTSKRKTIGIRIPKQNVIMSLLEQLPEPLLSTSILPTNISESDDYNYYNEPEIFKSHYENLVDCIINSGPCPAKPTTIIDLTGDSPETHYRS